MVLAGGISPLANAMIPSLTEQLGHITQHVPRVTVSVLGDDVVACGAARIALDAVNGELLDDPGSLRPRMMRPVPALMHGLSLPGAAGDTYVFTLPSRRAATERATDVRRNNTAGGRRG